MKFLKTVILPSVVTLSFSLAAAGVLRGEEVKGQPVKPGNFLQQLNEGFTGIYDKASPSVVIIDIAKKELLDEDSDMDAFDFFIRPPGGGGGGAQPGQPPNRFKLPSQSRKSEGSGFFVRQDGYILTNNHVVDGAEKIDVKLKDGRRFSAKVVGTDEKSDIAVLKVEGTGFPVLELGDSDAVKIGQFICSIGTPYNLDYSFACGWVSGKGRTNLTSTTYEDYIQTDSFVNPGDSGGPVLDVDGKVIGMNTLINGVGRKLTFAIPSNMLKDIGNQLIANGRVSHSWLGIGINTLGDDSSLSEMIKGIDHGVVVRSIEGGAPAYKSDLRVTDVITQVDGREVTTAHELQKEILKKKVGQSVALTVWRDGKTLQVPVVTGELPTDMTKVSNAVPKKTTPGEAKSAGDYGFEMQNLNKDTAEKLRLKNTRGALVTEVTPNSPAALAGVQPDDVITGVNSQAVDDAAGCKTLLDKNDADKGILLFINRRGQKTYAVLKADK